MEYSSIDGVIIDIWSEYSSRLLEQGICTELNEVDGNYEICLIYDNARRLIKFKPLDKKEGCSCKTKELITKFPKRINPDDYFYPTPEQVVLAYNNLRDRIKGREYFISQVYEAVLNEPFNWDCGNCKNNHSKKLKNFINQKLNINI
jgi:hypothetical protein